MPRRLSTPITQVRSAPTFGTPQASAASKYGVNWPGAFVPAITAISPPQGGETASSPYRGVLVNERSRPFESSRNVSPVTDDALGGPALGETLRGWLAARKETEAHLANDLSAR